MPKLVKGGIMIGKKYKLESDSMNIALSRKFKSKKTGATYWVAEAYFANPQNALKYIVDQEIMETGFKDLETIAKRQKELYRMIEKIPREALRATTEGLKG